MTRDLDKAVAHNALAAGLISLAPNMQKRFAALLVRFQEEAGLDADGGYDIATEAALNELYQRVTGQPITIRAPVAGAVPIPSPPVGMTNVQVVARIRPFVGRPLAEGRYILGAGGKWNTLSPFAPISQWLADLRKLAVGTLGCDCSGLVAWGQGYVRGDYNTDAMVADVWRVRYGLHTDEPGPRKLFAPVDADDMRPGDVVVYPGPDKNKDGNRETPGHTGIISSVEAGTEFGDQESEWWERVKVIHCSSRSQAKIGAIRETNAALWWDASRSVVVRCKRVRYTP